MIDFIALHTPQRIVHFVDAAGEYGNFFAAAHRNDRAVRQNRRLFRIRPHPHDFSVRIGQIIIAVKFRAVFYRNVQIRARLRIDCKRMHRVVFEFGRQRLKRKRRAVFNNGIGNFFFAVPLVIFCAAPAGFGRFILRQLVYRKRALQIVRTYLRRRFDCDDLFVFLRVVFDKRKIDRFDFRITRRAGNGNRSRHLFQRRSARSRFDSRRDRDVHRYVLCRHAERLGCKKRRALVVAQTRRHRIAAFFKGAAFWIFHVGRKRNELFDAVGIYRKIRAQRKGDIFFCGIDGVDAEFGIFYFRVKIVG